MKPRNNIRRSGGVRGHRAKLAPAGAVDETRGPRQVIEQAARDIGRGLRDTDLHGIPSNVPGPGPAPEQSPGADVPPEGVEVDK